MNVCAPLWCVAVQLFCHYSSTGQCSGWDDDEPQCSPNMTHDKESLESHGTHESLLESRVWTGT